MSRQAFDFDVFFQVEPTVFEQVSPDAETYEEVTEDTPDGDYATTEFSGSGDVTAELVAVELTLPPTEVAKAGHGSERTAAPRRGAPAF